MSRSIPAMARQARRRAGMPRKTRKASTVAVPAFAQSDLPVRELAMWPGAAEAAVVEKLTVAVALVVLELSVIGEPVTEQLGESTAPDGELVRAQVTAMLPL
jgi:hypothetical protein